MKPFKTINGAQINNLITKFYYKENHLCFDILIKLESKTTIPYKVFTDYSEYRDAFNDLLTVKSNNELINIPILEPQTTYSTLV